jgi:hypothetical protein
VVDESHSHEEESAPSGPTTCVAGTFRLLQAGTDGDFMYHCYGCPAGKFSGEDNQGSCDDCAVGKNSLAGSTSCGTHLFPDSFPPTFWQLSFRLGDYDSVMDFSLAKQADLQAALAELCGIPADAAVITSIEQKFGNVDVKIELAPSTAAARESTVAAVDSLRVKLGVARLDSLFHSSTSATLLSATLSYAEAPVTTCVVPPAPAHGSRALVPKPAAAAADRRLGDRADASSRRLMHLDPPTILMHGQKQLSFVVDPHAVYIDVGAECEDGGAKMAATRSGDVNLAVAGAYTVTYSCTGSNGVDASPLSRAITVVAKEAQPAAAHSLECPPPALAIAHGARVSVTHDSVGSFQMLDLSAPFFPLGRCESESHSPSRDTR